MKTVGDLKSFVDHLKNDINELQAPMIRKELVFHTNIASQRLENTRSIIASILEHSAGSSVTTTPDAVRWAIRHIINIMSNFKKNLTRCWAEVEVFLNEQFIVSIDTAEDVAVLLPVLNTEINVMCNPPLPIPLHVRTDCIKIVLKGRMSCREWLK